MSTRGTHKSAGTATAPAVTQVRPVPIGEIEVGPRLRELRPAVVESLAESIRETGGLLEPIGVTPRRPSGYRLVFGAHRLEACRRLGWAEIPARVLEMGELMARLAQIDENLVRADLTALEQAVHLAERKRVYLALHPETRHGGAPGAGHGRGKRSRDLENCKVCSFVTSTSGLTGQGERAIFLKVQIGEALEAVADCLKGTPIEDNQSELVKLARLRKQDHSLFRRVVDRLASGADPTVSQAVASVRRGDALERSASAPVPAGAELIHGDFRDVLPRLGEGSVDLVFTDPPYDADSVPLYADLAREAARVLKPGGSLLAYAGHHAVADIIAAAREHLRFWWIIAVVHGGSHGDTMDNYRSLAGKRVYVGWKPVLWFVKPGPLDAINYPRDIVFTDPPDKAQHDWAQSIEAARYYVSRLTPPGGLVLDPMAGSGTTVVAALLEGRRAIGVELDPAAFGRMRTRIADAVK